MDSIVFSSKNFFKNAVVLENQDLHTLTCEFDINKDISIHDINSRLMQNDGVDLYNVEYVVDGDVNKTYYGYTIIDSIEQIDTITEGYVRCRVVLRYPTLNELIPMIFKSLVKLNTDGETTNADMGGMYAQVTSDLRVLIMESLNK